MSVRIRPMTVFIIIFYQVLDVTSTKTTCLDGCSTQSSVDHFEIDVNDCSSSSWISINASRGVVEGFINEDTYNDDSPVVCLIAITLPEGWFAEIYPLHVSCAYDESLSIYAADSQSTIFARTSHYSRWTCTAYELLDMRYHGPFRHSYTWYPSSNNRIYLQITATVTAAKEFTFRFDGSRENQRQRMEVVNNFGNSHNTQFITLPGFDKDLLYAPMLNVTYVVYLQNQIALVSFRKFDLQDPTLRPNAVGIQSLQCYDNLELYAVHKDEIQTLIWRKCGVQTINASLYNTSIKIKFQSENYAEYTGFAMLISFHETNVSKLYISHGIFNCSEDYNTIREHLDCNLRQECLGGEDEHKNCQYIAENGTSCDTGKVPFKDKCVSYHEFPTGRKYMTWYGARLECQKQGEDLAMPKTPEELDKIFHMMDIGAKGRCAYLGLQTAPISPLTQNMYRRALRWVDKTSCFYCNVSLDSQFTIALQYPFLSYAYGNIYQPLCFAVMLSDKGIYYPVKCSETVCNTFFCETKNSQQEKRSPSSMLLQETNAPRLERNPGLTECPKGHFVHTFLTCDIKSNCGIKRHVNRCDVQMTSNELLANSGFEAKMPTQEQRVALSVAMFECYTMGETIPYTLVCDFRRDCQDGSDEQRCSHVETVSGFQCSSMESISRELVCDYKDDCTDGSDEVNCIQYTYYTFGSFYRKPTPLIIYMYESGEFDEKAFNASNRCPETHFRCPGEHVYCLPVFLACNGAQDCPGGEDEVSCDDVTCPGYYRCRSSSVCLHGDHVCDGWPQCPERDDELLCNASCPSACHCQGLAFVCQQTFAASHYPDLRYMDATGSGMVPEDVADNLYLLFLNLATCALKSWPKIVIPNLQLLDLSYNFLSVLYTDNICLLKNLRVLRLKGNPLKHLINSNADTRHSSLITFDVSYTHLTNFSSEVLYRFPYLQNLNLSHSRINAINDRFALYLQNLYLVDLTGCDIQEFPMDLFEGLIQLETISTSMYQLCCKVVIPKMFNSDNCFFEEDEISTCENLVHLSYRRVFLWCVALIALIGNTSYCISRLKCSHKVMKQDSSHIVLFTNLCFSKCITGVYLIIICAVDELFRGTFVLNENTWKMGSLCKITGFLSQVSNEVSLFMICLMTIDIFLVLRFPFSTVRFKGRSAVSASALAWTVGLLLAAVPLLPSLSHWSFYGQTSICLPMLLSKDSSVNTTNFLSSTRVLDFIISLAVLVLQGYICTFIWASSASVPDLAVVKTKSRVARRFVHLILLDATFRFPAYVADMAAITYLPVPNKIYSIMALFLLPVSSSLLPILYMYTLFQERQHSARELKIQKRLQASLPVLTHPV